MQAKLAQIYWLIQVKLRAVLQTIIVEGNGSHEMQYHYLTNWKEEGKQRNLKLGAEFKT